MNFTSKVITTIIAASALLPWKAEAQVADYGRDNGVISFENSTENAIAGKGSRLSISDEHNKLGHNSLMW